MDCLHDGTLDTEFSVVVSVPSEQTDCDYAKFYHQVGGHLNNQSSTVLQIISTSPQSHVSSAAEDNVKSDSDVKQNTESDFSDNTVSYETELKTPFDESIILKDTQAVTETDFLYKFSDLFDERDSSSGEEREHIETNTQDTANFLCDLNILFNDSDPSSKQEKTFENSLESANVLYTFNDLFDEPESSSLIPKSEGKQTNKNSNLHTVDTEDEDNYFRLFDDSSSSEDEDDDFLATLFDDKDSSYRPVNRQQDYHQSNKTFENNTKQTSKQDTCKVSVNTLGCTHLENAPSNSDKPEMVDKMETKPLVKRSDSEIDWCVICMDGFSKPKILHKCSHKFCEDCINQYFKVRPQCPVCFVAYGVITGNQPKSGNMSHTVNNRLKLPGYESHKTIVVYYSFPDGIQTEEHPNPGQEYYGTSRTAYLPDNDEGRKVLRLLKEAFKRRLVFTVGRSRTTGCDNQVTWNDIHHKTCTNGGQQGFGYPDPTYLARVQEELAAFGVTPDSL